LNNSKDVLKSIENLRSENEELKKQLQQFEDKAVSELKSKILASVEQVGAVKFFASTTVELNSVEALRKVGIQLANELKENFVLLLSAEINGKRPVHLRLSPSFRHQWQSVVERIGTGNKRRRPCRFCAGQCRQCC
jgi:alanyl-tRNA synthetase